MSHILFLNLGLSRSPSALSFKHDVSCYYNRFSGYNVILICFYSSVIAATCCHTLAIIQHFNVAYTLCISINKSNMI